MAGIGELNFSKQNIRDSQLQMLFAICTDKTRAKLSLQMAQALAKTQTEKQHIRERIEDLHI